MNPKWIVERRYCLICCKSAYWCYPTGRKTWDCPDCGAPTEAERSDVPSPSEGEGPSPTTPEGP